MERVAAVTAGEIPVAYPFSALSEALVINDEIAGEPVVVFWAAGTASALDAGRVAEGRDVGSSGVFFRRAGERTLSFQPAEAGRFVDRQTGSVWDHTGKALSGPLRGSRLRPIPHGDYFWFAWAAFQPETEIRRP